jgi:hypothetical protein
MTDIAELRNAITGLLAYAGAEEEMLLATARRSPVVSGRPDCWAAIPVIAHNTEFKRQQVRRLTAIRAGDTPPEFTEIDHRSAEVYRGYSGRPADQVARDSREVTAALIDGLGEISDEDLLDPARHPWLRGRQLGLQIIVRGFWHPLGHLGEFYAAHARPDRAVTLSEHATAAAAYLNAPPAAQGMAWYNLACAQAQAQPQTQASQADGAVGSLEQAIRLNPDLRANARRDADLDRLRGNTEFSALIAE